MHSSPLLPPSPPSPSCPMAMERVHYHVNPSRRARASQNVVISTLAMEHQEFLLHKHAILLTAATPNHVANPMSVGRAFDEQLRTPAHVLWVTSHVSEDFLVYFKLPAHHENAVRRGSITVDNVAFTNKAWHEDDHAIDQDFKLHVCVVIEKMSMQLWSLEGVAKIIGGKCIIDCLDTRTHECGHTKTFAWWVWV
ncbi:hypothetical protein D1007_45196 [Hordeum vulgare]|nr:hypothetical protein D1007_45196 [Hordeum vulgare]